MQVPLLVVAAVVPPSTGEGQPGQGWGSRLGAVSVSLVGLVLAVGGALQLGRALTALPVPKATAVFTTSGVYRWVRHPIYTGAVLTFLGWSWWWGSWLGALWCLVLFCFFDRKAAVEERWLVRRFPEYEAYRRRVAKFLPGIY